MPYTVAGTLKLPESNKPAAGVILTFVALASISPVLGRSESSVVTSATGAYSISLEFNTYSVLATLYDNKALPCGEILVNSQTPAGLDLPTLLNGGQYEPPTPAWILQIQAWVAQASASAAASQQSATASQASATAAAASAAQASQITGLGTVAEAVSLAALPLPDVWAPLSDSLTLVTGYGRDVLVGTDVVARMLSFSRNSTATYIGKDGLLKTAAVNEPRFQKAGLFIEGQSTNVWASQTSLETINAAPASTSLPDGTTGNAYKITPTRGAYAYVRRNFSTQAGINTLSCYAKIDDDTGAIPSLYCGVSGGLSTKMAGVYVGNGWWRMQASFTAPTGNIAFGYNPTSIETKSVWVCNFQLEALPFATSYIPTSGVAMVRAPDVPFAPAPGNIGSLGFSLAAEFETQRDVVSTTAENACLFSMEQSGRARMTIIRGKYGSGDADYGFATHCGAYGQAGYVTTVLKDFTAKDKSGIAVVSEGNGFLKLRVNSTLSSISSSTATAAPVPPNIYLGCFGGPGVQPLFGHLRNLRIWQRTLTDAQIRAIA